MYDKLSISNAKIEGTPFVLSVAGVSAADPLGTIVMANSTYTNVSNATNTAQFATVVWTNVMINGAPAH